MMKSRKSIQASEFSEFLKKKPSVEEVLAHEKTIEEVCCCNAELVNYINSQTLREIICYIIEEPQDPNDFIKSCKFPMIASEFFASDLTVVNKVLFTDLALMKFLFSFLDSSKKLNFLLAGYFQKAFETCLAYDPDRFMDFIFTNNYQVDLLKKLQSMCIAEILLSVLQQKSYIEERTILIYELCNQLSSDVQMISSNSSSILIKVSKDDDLFNTLASPSMTDQLLSHLKSFQPFTIKNSLTVLKNLLTQSPEALSSHLIKNINLLTGVLFNNSSRDQSTQFGLKVRSFGEHRLLVLDIFSILCTQPEVGLSSSIPSILDLFPIYQWNSYFHNSFTSLIESILNSQNNDLIESLTKSNFPDLLITLAQDTQVQVKENLSISKGLVGHLFKIINLLANSQVTSVSESVKTVNLWKDFEPRLNCYNEVEARTIGGKVNVNFFENMSSDSTDKADEIDLLPDYPYTKPITGKELDDLNELFDLEEKTPQKSPFMSTKIVQTATLEELKANEFLDSIFWKIEVNVDNLEEVE